MTDRRDFLKFGVGASLAGALMAIGKPEGVRLATPLEVERLRAPIMPRQTLYWDAQLVRPDGQAVMRFRGHPQGMLRWLAAPGDEIYLEDGHRLSGFMIACDIA